MHRRTVVRLTLLNAVACVLISMAIPMPSSWSSPPVTPAPTDGAVTVSAVPTRRPAPVVDPGLIESALASTRADHRVLGVQLVAAGPAPRSALLRLLDSSHDEVAVAAARALDELDGSVERLRRMVLEDVDPAGARAELLVCSADGAVRLLEESLEHADPYVRGIALRALAIRAPGRAVPYVAEALRSTEDSLRYQALEAALHCPAPGHAPALRSAAASSDPLERRLALGALVAAGHDDARRRLVAEQRRAADWEAALLAETMVVAGLADGVECWREALLALGPAERVRLLRRHAAVLPPALVPELRGLLRDSDAEVRTQAALLLGRHAPERVGDDVLGILGAPVGSRRLEAAVVLAGIAR